VKWISVKNKKPPDDETVLVWCPELGKPKRPDGQGVLFGHYVECLEEFRVNNSVGFYFITHWMPLPNPPEPGQ
jgi:hypothetical protein